MPESETGRRLFLVRGGSCVREAAEEEARACGGSPPSGGGIYVSAPPWVREGWGYDPRRSGDGRFLAPAAPAGWRYDRGTGTFFRPREREE